MQRTPQATRRQPGKLALIAFVLAFIFTDTNAAGNYPDAGKCIVNKPYYPFCTHSLHNLEGWYGNCYSSKKEAEKEASKHVQQLHLGNNRWTGVNGKIQSSVNTKY